MFSLFFETLLYAIPAALVAGILGYVMPELLWVVILAAAIVLVPIIISMIHRGHFSHPGRMGEFLMWVSNIFWAEVALWAGFLLQ